MRLQKIVFPGVFAALDAPATVCHPCGMKSAVDDFTITKLADDASSGPKNRSPRCPNGLPNVAQGREALRAHPGRKRLRYFLPTVRYFAGQELRTLQTKRYHFEN